MRPSLLPGLLAAASRNAARGAETIRLFEVGRRYLSEAERPMVYDRLAALAGAPAGTTRQGTLGLDLGMLDRWWNSFDLGDIGVWRFWEQSEAPRVKKAAG